MELQGELWSLKSPNEGAVTSSAVPCSAPQGGLWRERPRGRPTSQEQTSSCFLTTWGPEVRGRSSWPCWTKQEGYVGLRIPRGGGEMSASLRRSEETEGDRRLQGVRSKEEKQRRNKGKTSASASYQKQHLLFPRKGSAAAPKTNYSGRREKARRTVRREK